MYTKIISLKHKIILLISTVILTFSSQSLAQTYNSYGNYLNADGLANLEIGKSAGRRVSYRFRAEYTATVDSVRLFFIYRSGYAKGDGGDIQIQLKTDDGTSSHLPSTTVLSSYIIKDPMSQNFPLVYFNSPAQLEKGKLYHIEFSNVASDPINNYVSVDDLYNSSRTSNMQPGFSDVDLAVLWKSSGSSSYVINYGHTPIFCLYYTNGLSQGTGYIDAFSSSGLRTISGNSKVRMAFKVSGGDKTVNGVNVRVKKINGASGLNVRLESSNGNLIEEGTIPASSISTTMNWVKYNFKSSHALTVGQSYNIVCSSSGGSYSTFGIQEGTNFGFDYSTVFADGRFQYTTGGSWIDDHGGLADMQLYFNLSESTQETNLPPTSPQNLHIVKTN